MHSTTFGKGTLDGFERFIDWCHALLGEQIGIAQHGRSGDQHTLKIKEGPELTFVRDPSTDVCSVQCATPLPEHISRILHDASERAARGDMGKTQWWRVSFSTRKALDASFGLHMMRMLGQTRAFKGRWRLGKDVLAEFTVDDPKQLVAFAQQKIMVTFRCAGPGHGPRSALLARRQADVIRAVLSFCTAAIIEDGGLVKPITDAEFPAGSEVNTALPELSVQGLAIWSRLTEAALVGAFELVSRAVNALTAYEHALHQPTDRAATMFYVASIEALTVPNNRYANLRVTSRFTKSLVELARPRLEETLKHANFTEGFDRTGKRVRTATDLANRIYTLRSSPVHTGQFGLERSAVLGMVSPQGPIRAALLAEIAEAAFLEFLKRPFTSLIGHMDFDPVCRVELTEEEHAVVRAAAHDKGQSIEDYILLSLGLEPRTRG